MRNGELSKELERKKDLETASVEIQYRNRELEKKRNLRQGDEEVFGWGIPSSKKVFKENSTEENQSRKGGGQPGRTGSSMFLSETQRFIEESNRDVRLRRQFEVLSEAGIENQRANHGNMPSSCTASCESIFAEYFPEKEDCLFQWIQSSHISCENNYAERGLRPLAVTGKISYGSQSERGMKTREILASVLHTAAARGLEQAAFLEAFLNDS